MTQLIRLMRRNRVTTFIHSRLTRVRQHPIIVLGNQTSGTSAIVHLLADYGGLSKTIDIPPLRQRRDDIPLLIDHFISEANDRHGTSIKGVSPEVRRLLTSFQWPGNVRQLRNVVDNMVVLASRDKLAVEDLPADIYSPRALASDDRFTELAGISIEEAEKQLIRNTLRMVEGNRNRAAGILGIGERTLYRKIKEYGIGKD